MSERRLGLIEIFILVAIGILIALWVSGCRIVSIKEGSVWACGVFTDTSVDYVRVEPNLVIAGQYVSDTDDTTLVAPSIILKTE